MKKWEEYKFKIDVYTPETLPMARCAEYMAELAAILGETPYVHFIKVGHGSANLVHRIDIEAVPRVMENTKAVEKGMGTSDQMRAYRNVNRMLRENNGTGTLKKGRAKVLYFPGKEEELLKLTSIQQQGEIDGEIARVGGIGEIIPILLTSEGETISGCHTKRIIAKELAKNLFESVRLYGEGRWERDIEGRWNLISFSVDRFEVLKETSLSKTILALRGLKGEWKKNSLQELLESRHNEKDTN
ncbi:hypothetical protein JXA85_04910 [Candidatus Woesearchaeota archaeon]|nr:hypothetical protein [Candidatus Woesearchaeota archaeon]